MPTNSQQSLCFVAATAYLSRGYSVIPVWGDSKPEQAKVAAVEWKKYQHRKPTEADLRYWFVEKDYPALAIVTGRISGICVLDLDSKRAYDLFCKTCPDLVENHVIKSPRGWHIYFRLPPTLHLPSRKVPEADWLADGRYVVTRPTPGYKLIRGGEPLLLDQPNLNRIEAFLDLLARTVAPRRTWTAEPPVTAEAKPLPVSTHTLVSQYHYLAPQIGRNEALFRLSLKARDHGWSVDDTITALADIHASQPATGDHAHESEKQRRKEAIATIVSAFSRPARPVQVRQGRGLPVSVVEALYEQGLTSVVRVINTLRERGVEPGQPFSYTQARRLLQGSRVGKHSLRKALQARLADGQPVFPPSGLPHAPDGAAGDTHQPDYQINAYLIGRQNRNKVPVHRPQVFVTMPSDTELCQRLGVKLTRPDPMTSDDLASARGTRLATMREQIGRRPGQYFEQWQGRRLGVSKRTIQRYQHLIPGLQVTPVYAETRLHWGNLNVLPDDDTFKGAFLQDETGKKYPPIAGIAAKLLKQGRAVSYRRQQANYYSLVSPTVAALQTVTLAQPLVIVQPKPIQPPPAAAPQGLPVLSAPTDTAAPSANYQPALPNFFPFRRAAPPPSAKPRLSHRLYRKPLADTDHEALAQRVYKTINARTDIKADCISLVSARRYVNIYGISEVERALKETERRRNITKPVGFFATVLRSSNKLK